MASMCFALCLKVLECWPFRVWASGLRLMGVSENRGYLILGSL